MKKQILILISLIISVYFLLNYNKQIDAEKPNISNTGSVKVININKQLESEYNYYRLSPKEVVIQVLKEYNVQDIVIESLSGVNIIFNSNDNIDKETKLRILGTYSYSKNTLTINGVFTDYNNSYILTENQKYTILHESIHVLLYKNRDLYEKIEKEFLTYRTVCNSGYKCIYNYNFVLELFDGNRYTKGSNYSFIHEFVAYNFSTGKKEYKNNIGEYIFYKIYKKEKK